MPSPYMVEGTGRSPSCGRMYRRCCTPTASCAQRSRRSGSRTRKRQTGRCARNSPRSASPSRTRSGTTDCLSKRHVRCKRVRPDRPRGAETERHSRRGSPRVSRRRHAHCCWCSRRSSCSVRACCRRRCRGWSNCCSLWCRSRTRCSRKPLQNPRPRW